MLYLMRKVGESIIINDDIEVKVMEIRGKSVKLGFDFPPSATVLRKEIHDRVVEENIAASQSDVDMGLEQDISDAILKVDVSKKDSSNSNKADES